MRTKKLVPAEIDKVMGASLLSYNFTRKQNLSIEAFYAVSSMYPGVYMLNLDRKIDAEEEKLIAFLLLSMTQLIEDSFPEEAIAGRINQITQEIKNEFNFLTIAANAEKVEQRLLEALKLQRVVDSESIEESSATISDFMTQIVLLSGKDITTVEKEAIREFMRWLGLTYIEPNYDEVTDTHQCTNETPPTHHLQIVFGNKHQTYQDFTKHTLSIQAYYSLLYLFPAIYVIHLDKRVDILEKVTLDSIRDDFLPDFLADKVDPKSGLTIESVMKEVNDEMSFLLQNTENLKDHFQDAMQLFRALAPIPRDFRDISALISDMMHTIASMSGFMVTDEEIDYMKNFMTGAGLEYIEP